MQTKLKSSSLAAVLSLALTAGATTVACGDDDGTEPQGNSSGKGGASSAAGTGGASTEGDAGTGASSEAQGGASGGAVSGDAGETGDAGAAGAAGARGASEPPLYAVVSIPASTGGAPQTSYVILSDSLTGELKLEDAVLEIEGSALAVGPAGGKRLYVATSTDAVVTRYDLTEDGKLEESGTVDFAAKQVTSFSGYAAFFQFIDEHKAYWISPALAKIVVWDPEDLTVSGEIPLPELSRPDPANPGTNYTTSITGAPLRHEDKLYFFGSWDTRQAGTIKVAPASAVVVVDTDDDTANVVVDENSCGYTRDGVIDGDYIYLATEAVGTAVNYLDPANGEKPCLRRFNIKDAAFDDDYDIDLNAIAGGPAGSMVVSPNGQALIYVLDTDDAGPKLESGELVKHPRFLSTAAVWKSAKLTVGDDPTVEILEDVPLASSSVLPHVLKDNLKVTATFDAEPHIHEVTDDGVVATDRANAKLNGNTGSIVQLR